jgi:hypothetical protein
MIEPTTDAVSARLNGPIHQPTARPAWRPPTISVIDAKLTETGVNSTTDAIAQFS